MGFVVMSCKNDQNDYEKMKGINYFSRTDAFSTEQISFDNSTGVLSDTLKKGAVLSIDPNTFQNADGSVYSGKVVLVVKENYARGLMALNSAPTISDLNPLYTEGEIYSRAVDLVGNELIIVPGKHLTISIPGSTVASNYTMFYAEDKVKDPSPANTALFNWKEASTDIVESTLNTANARYYYKLIPTQLGWISCSRVIANSSPVGIRIRIKGVYPIFASNTAVYLIPKNSKSVYRLWNYDSNRNIFSMDSPYLNIGDQAYIVSISSIKHNKIFYARELVTISAYNAFEIEASLATTSNIIADLSVL